MRLLYWTPLFRPDVGGIEKTSAHLVSGLREKGWDIIILTSHGRIPLPDETRYHDMPVYRFPVIRSLASKNPSQIIKIQKKITEIIKGFAPDMAHINFGGPAPIGYFYLKTANAHPCPSILTLHNSMEGLEARPDAIHTRIFNQASWVTACSGAMLDEACLLFPQIESRSSVVHYGLPLPEVEPTLLPVEEPKILCLGRLVKEKGFDVAISAFAEVVKKHPGARLVIAGDGPARPALERQVAELSLSGTIDFIGEVSLEKVPFTINTATMVVVPSRWREPFPLVALEAAQMGRPVVASRVGGLPESVIHQKTGLLFEKDNVRDLADSLIFLLDHPETIHAMGREARTRSLQLFNLEKYVNAYESLYQKLIHQTGASGASRKT